MKATKRAVALLLILAMMATMISVFAGCAPTGDSEQTTGEVTGGATGEVTGPTNNETSAPSENKAGYSVKVQTVGGLLMSGIHVYVYSDEALEEMEGYVATDENGIAQFSLATGKTYYIVLSGIPEGYDVADSYTFDSARTANITLTSSVIADTDLSGVSYKLGDVMRDFTTVDSDGNTHKLSDILKEKKACVLNFWYTTCSYCVEEFPYLNATYEKYKDKAEVLALNNYSDDDEESVKLFKSSYGLTFPMAKDYSALGTAMGLTGYPTTVVIDRYGVIVLMITGGTSEKVFEAAFAHVTADNYEQKLFSDMEELSPTVKPTVQMPSSDKMAAALNKGEITVTYTPETVMPDAEYSWPFLIGEKNGIECVYPSNQSQDNSFATLYANVTLKAGEALAFDYLASSESAADILFVLVDRKDIYQISGESTDWATCYPFVAIEDGTYELSFCYFKDDSTNVGDDTVYLKDLRVVSADSIDTPTYIPRYAANHLREDGFGYESYVDVVYNEADGYYHVGTVDGPILLADLMGSTRFSGESVYSLAYTGKMVVDGKNYYEDILPYFTMASNATVNGLCSVTNELAELLKIMAQAEGIVASAAKGTTLATYTRYIQSFQEKVLSKNPKGMVMGFLSNHDMDRIGGSFILEGNMRMAANLYLLAPGSPMIYYGEEIGLRGSRGGESTDANRRLAMRWGDEDLVRDPVGSTYPEKNQIQTTVADQLGDENSLLRYYQRLIALRHQYPAIARGSYTALDWGNRNFGGFIISWEGEEILLLHNTSTEELTVDFSKVKALEGREITQILACIGGGSASMEGTVLTLGGQSSVLVK